MSNFENTPRCRLCGYSLKAVPGCAVCLDVKTALVWPVLSDENSEVSATSVISTALKSLRSRLRRIERELKSEQTYDPSLTRDISTISRALKELASEQRRLEDREEERYDKLGIEGRMKLFVAEFFAKLPQDFQVRLLTGMKEAYDIQNASLLPEHEKNTLE